MPVFSSLRSLPSRLGREILKRGRDLKSRLSSDPFRKGLKSELHEDVLADRPPPSDAAEGHGGSDLPPREYQLVIDTVELLLKRTIFSTTPWPDSTNEVQSAVLTAAAEGRWEAIQQAFHLPDQKPLVLGARNECGWTPLHFAAHSGHLHLVKQLITVTRLPPDQRSKHHWTPLFVAAWAGQQEVVRYLLREQEVDLHIRDVDGRSLLHAATHSGNFALVQWLVSKHGLEATVTKDDGTLLIPAAESGNALLFDWLVSRYRLNPNQWNENGLNHPLLSAATFEHLQLTQHLIQKYSCDVYCKDEGGWTLLHCTAVGGSVELFEWLMAKYKFDAEAKTADGCTPLMWAAAFGHLPLARLLVEMYKCDVNVKDDKVRGWEVIGESCTPVMWAARWGQLPVLVMLVEHGGNVHHKALDSSTALHWAASSGSIECLEYLMPLFGDKKFELDAKGWTCLHYAIWGGSLPVMRYLVDQCGFDLSLRTAPGSTPLMLAAEFGHLPLARLLVETYNCDVNEERMEDSSTALHRAALGGSIECVKYLLPHFGDRKFVMDADGWTCLHYAVDGGSLPVMRYLVDQCGFDLSLRTGVRCGPKDDTDGDDCFLLACWTGHKAIVRELLTKDKVDQNVVNNDGRGAVHLACERGHAHLVKNLVDEFGLSPDTRDNAGRTPIQLATDSDLADLLKVLQLQEDSSAPHSHESVLEKRCWLPLGIESLYVPPDGGVFPLASKGREEEEGGTVIQLRVPRGAVRAVGKGTVEVRYAVIADGPFRTPEGYNLCSMAVYIHYNPALTTKPFYLTLPHWSGALDHPVFVTSPHTLPEGEQYYPFRLLEGGEFGEGYGIVDVDGHCSLFGQAFKLQDTSRYYASLWEREEGNIVHSKVAVTFKSNVWIRILSNHWARWNNKQIAEAFEMEQEHIEGSLSECSGRGWNAAFVGRNWVVPQDIEYKKEYGDDELELQYAVEEHLYPPALSVHVVQSQVPRHLQANRRILLHVHISKQRIMNFPIDFLEVKEVPSGVVAREVSSVAGSTERPPSLTHQAHTTEGEMEVVQSRSKAAMSDRDPLSQPVHLCERYAVLFRKYVSRQAAGRGKAILEWVGLTPEEIKFCYQNNPLNEEEAVQDGLNKWRETHGDHCTWKVLYEAMKFAGVAQQHCSELEEELHQRMQGNN